MGYFFKQEEYNNNVNVNKIETNPIVWRKKSAKLDQANEAVENLHIENMRLIERIDSLEKKEYPYNIEFGDGRTKEEMDKMQDDLTQSLKEEACGCKGCGCN